MDIRDMRICLDMSACLFVLQRYPPCRNVRWNLTSYLMKGSLESQMSMSKYKHFKLTMMSHFVATNDKHFTVNYCMLYGYGVCTESV